MGRHAESPGVQEWAAGALGNLSESPGVQEQAAELGIITADAKNQRQIGAQVANAHEYICALPEANVAIGNRNHTHF
jgi:hypothetical protein